MKKLHRKGKIHPSPPLISDHLAFLPAAILTLTAALSPEDREVLAYLISCSESSVIFSGGRKNSQKSRGNINGDDHLPLFSCNCFRCYMSYWVRWDSSINRQLIHEIIDAFEDELQKRNLKNKKERRKRGCNSNRSENMKAPVGNPCQNEVGSSESVEISDFVCNVGEEDDDHEKEEEEEEGIEKGLVRRFMSFLGERIWGF